MGKADVIENIRKFSSELSKKIKFKKIILFGSFARGNANADSDIDIAVVVDTFPGDFLKITPVLWKIAAQIDSRIEPIILVEGKDDSGFLESISKYGETISA
jgi:predicted nucleotidyltransferase